MGRKTTVEIVQAAKWVACARDDLDMVKKVNKIIYW